MSGYIGNPDAESEHALILAENGIHAAQQMLVGPVLEECQDCGEEINPKRVAYARQQGMKCMYCIQCQVHHDKPVGVKMLDRIL